MKIQLRLKSFNVSDLKAASTILCNKEEESGFLLYTFPLRVRGPIYLPTKKKIIYCIAFSSRQ